MVDRVYFRPPGHFRTRAEILTADIDASIRSIQTAGYASAGKGSGKYIRMLTAPSDSTNRGYARSIDRYTSSGATDATNGGYWQLDLEQGLKATMFGAVGDDSTSDQTAMEDAIDFCDSAKSGAGGLFIPLCLPIAAGYVTTSPIRLKQGMHIYGEGHFNEEFSDRVKWRNSTTDIFDMVNTGTSEQRNTKGIIFTGIRFDGGSYTNGTSFITPQALDASEGKLQYSRFAFCAFNNFDVIMSWTGTGVEIHNCYFNNSNVIFNLGGSDHFIHDNFMGGNEHAENSQTTYSCTFGTFNLSRFSRNFMTGRPQRFFHCTGQTKGTIFSENWFDICEDSAVFLDGGTGATFIGNTFHQVRLDATPTAGFDAMVRIDDWVGSSFIGNVFYYDSGDEPVSSPTTFEFNGTCSQNIISANLYTDGYDRLIDVASTATCEWPIVSGEYPLPPTLVANASIVWKPGQSETIVSATTLDGNRTVDLSAAGAQPGARVRVLRTETGAFTLAVRNGVGGSAVKTFASGTAGWGDFYRTSAGAWAVEASGADIT